MNPQKSFLTVILLFCFLFAIRAQVESDDNGADLEYEDLEEDTLSRRADESLDFDEDRRPRGLIAALFGYPDEFEDGGPTVNFSEDDTKGRSYGYRRDFKKMKALGSAYSKGSPYSKGMRSKMAPPRTTTEVTTTTTEKEMFLRLPANAMAENEMPPENITDVQSAATGQNSSDDSEVPDLDMAESMTNSTNSTEESPSSKREAKPSGKDTRNAPMAFAGLPFGNGPQPLPAGYILWHPVPAPFHGGPDVPEMSMSSNKSPVMALPGPQGDGRAPAFIPHRPMFVEQFQGPFAHQGPFPITQFSTPPVFAVAPEETRSNTRERNKKPGKGRKHKNRPKNRPEESEEQPHEGAQGFFQPQRGMTPVHVLLPPIPFNHFRNGPNPNHPPPQNFGPLGNNNGPFQPNFDLQPLRQPQFDLRPQTSQQFDNRPQPSQQFDNRPPPPPPPPPGPEGPNSPMPQFPQQFPDHLRAPDGPRSPQQQQFQNGPNTQFQGPREQFRGPEQGPPMGPFRGPEPHQHKSQNKPKRPSPTPSAHPAKFEIEHHKKLQQQFHGQNGPPPLPPPIGPFRLPSIPAPPPAHFDLPPVRQQPFDFPGPPTPFIPNAPPPQFLDTPPQQSLAVPRPQFKPPQEQSALAASSTPLKSPPTDALHSIPPLFLPTASPFPDQQQVDFRQISSTRPPLTEDDAGLIYTRDFQKQINEIQPTTESPFVPSTFPTTSAPAKQHQPNFNSAPHFGLSNVVQRFPAISTPFQSGGQQQQQQQQQQQPSRQNHFGDGQRFQQGGRFGNDQRPQQNQFNSRNPQWTRQQDASQAESQRLPNIHPNLPDFNPDLPVNQRFGPSTTEGPEVLTPRPDLQATTDFPVLPLDNYPSPGFHTGHKGFPSSVTAPNYIASSVAPIFPTTPIPRVHRPTPTTKVPLGGDSFRSTTIRPLMPKAKNFFGTTFQSSFASSTADSKVPEYHYEIHYQNPAPAQNSFASTVSNAQQLGSSSTVAPINLQGPNQRISDFSDTLAAAADDQSIASTSSAFGEDAAPEYVSSTFRPAQGQGGSYKPGTSRILLEMNQWKKDDSSLNANSSPNADSSLQQ